MGTLGTDISENDLYKDLEIEFFDLYNTGIDAQTISEQVIKNHNESLNSDEDSNNFWLAIADFQWQCKSLNNEALSKVNQIVESKSDLDLWRELDASEININEREKKKFYDSIFSKGDCIIYKLENNKYGASLIVYEEKQTESGQNWLLISDINSTSEPSIAEIKKANVSYLERNNTRHNSRPLIMGIGATEFGINKDNNLEIIKIGYNKVLW